MTERLNSQGIPIMSNKKWREMVGRLQADNDVMKAALERIHNDEHCQWEIAREALAQVAANKES